MTTRTAYLANYDTITLIPHKERMRLARDIVITQGDGGTLIRGTIKHSIYKD